MTAPASVPRRAIIYSDGFGHPFAETTGVLLSMAEARGWAATVTSDIDEAIAALSDGAGLLIVNALRWEMTQHEKYAPYREAWAYSLPDEHMAALRDFVSMGGALLVMHTGTICWDNQPGWCALMGGGWNWSRSYHPPLGQIAIKLTDEGRGISEGPVRFALIDEAYHRLDPAPDCIIMAVAEAGDGPQPVAWMRREERGRIAVDALGHDARSLTAAGHAALIGGIMDWLGSDGTEAG